MTRGQLITAVARKLRLDTTVGGDELTALQDWANAGVVDVLLKTHCYVDVGDMTLTAGSDIYRTDDNILDVVGKRITSSNLNYTFERVSTQQILDLQNGVAPVTAPPGYFSFEGGLLTLWPAPASADKIRWIYVPKPSPMTDDAHDPSSATYGGIPTWGHRCIEYFMLWQGAEYDDKLSALTPKDYRGAYEQECDDLRKRTRKRGGDGLAGARVGYPGSVRGGRRNDVYPEQSYPY